MNIERKKLINTRFLQSHYKHTRSSLPTENAQRFQDRNVIKNFENIKKNVCVTGAVLKLATTEKISGRFTKRL